MVVDWILIADRSRACVRAVLPNGDDSFPVLKCLEHPAGRFTPHEDESDRPGRIQLWSGARTGVEPHEDETHVESRKFAHEIAEYLEHEHQENRFDRLHVVAPPAFLGVLRATWSDRLRRAIVQEIDSDWMPLPIAELKSRLVEMVAKSTATQ
jgi:protein required for attachment to host cells